MELSNKIKDRLSSYFNDLLRKSLTYPETFDIIVDLDNKRFVLTPNTSYSKLVELLQRNDFANKIEQSLLKGFQNFDNTINSIIIYVNPPNKIIITYQINTTIIDINEIGVYVKIASRLDNKSLGQMCNSDPKLNKFCNDELFWLLLFNAKYPEYRQESSINYNWKEIYLGMEYYIKFIKNREIAISRSGWKAQMAIKEAIKDSTKELIKKYTDTFEYLFINKFIKIEKDETYEKLRS